MVDSKWGNAYDKLLTPAYIIDEDSYELLYLNDAAKSKLTKGFWDGCCYEVFCGRDKPCDNCRPTTEDGAVRHWHNYINGVEYRVYGRREIREDGHKLLFCVAIEVSSQISKWSPYKTAAYWQDAVLEHTREFFACFDKDYFVVYSNPAMSRVTGWEVGDIAKGRYLSSKSAEFIFGNATSAVLKGETWSGIAELRKMDGTLIPCETDLFPIIGTDGEIIGIAVSMLDISSQIELERSNTRLQLAREAIRSGVWEMSVGDQQFTFDDGFKELMEVPYDSPISLSQWGDYIKGIITVEAYPGFLDELNTRFSGKTPIKLHEVRYNFHDGSFRYMNTDSKIQYNSDGEPNRIVGMLMDVTDDVLARKEADKLRDDKLRTQEIISNFSMPFTQPCEDFDGLMNDALSNLLKFLKPDRVALVEMQENKQLICTYECRKDDDVPSILGTTYDYAVMRPVLDEIDKHAYLYLHDPEDFYKRFPFISRAGKSICYVPIMSGGNRLGYLLFATMYEKANWSEDDFNFLNMASSVIMGAYSTRAILERNKREIRTQEFIQEFTAPFLQPYDFDELMNNSLKKLIDYFGRDRASLFVLSGDYYICKHCCTRNSNIPMLVGHTCKAEDVRHIMDNLQDNSFYFVKDTSAPDIINDKSFYKGTKSICYIPLGTSGKLNGFMSLSMLEESAEWTEEMFRLSVMAASVISGAKATKQALVTQKNTQEKLQMVLSSSGMGVWEVSVKDQLLFFDENLAKLFRITKPSPITIGQWADILTEILDLERYGDYIDYLRGGYTGTKYSDNLGKLEMCFPDGSVKYTTNAAKHILDAGGNTKQVIGITWEITDDVMLVKQLEETTLEAAEASKAKSEFLSRMSHEIRTPLNAIVGWTKIAHDSTDLKKRNDYLDSIQTASSQLLSIVNDVLDISKIESGKMVIHEEPFVLEHAVDKALAMVHKSAEEKSLSLEKHFDQNVAVWYLGDETRITQVLINLLSNAVKFTPDGGTTSISVHELPVDERGMPLIQIAVKDTGIGMSEEEISRVFNIFEQADGSTTRRFGGTGLGLSICKNLVERMGGSIEVESEQGVGSEFIVTLPLAHVDRTNNVADIHEEDVIGETDFSGMHILLAEDIEINQLLLISLLDGTGIQIDTAENGITAVEKFKMAPEKYDVILMDIHMPVLNGLDATRQIRLLECPEAKTVPIIALSASAFREDVEECLDAGMTDHLAKPVDVGLLIEKIRHYAK